jgi:hypothetical protein
MGLPACRQAGANAVRLLDSCSLVVKPLRGFAMAGVGAFGSAGRAVLGLANAAFDRQRKLHPKTKCNTGAFQTRFRSDRGGCERLRALVFAKYPGVLDL